MSDEPAYTVTVTREDGQWLADVHDLEGAHTFARTLPALDQAVREVVVLAADRPDEDIPRLRIDFHFRTGNPELDVEATEVRSLRAQADALTAVLGERTSAVATALVEQGFPVRDVAAVLGISPQRVSQITRARAG